MATWTQTLEPYIKVQERVKTVAQNPTAGESLIIGAVFISDAGPCTPTLITGQSEFLATYASQDMSQDYIESLNKFYEGDDSTLASTMWKNAYRLAGSNTMLMVRASKASDIAYVKPLNSSEENTDKWIVRDGEVLKGVNSFKIVIDNSGDSASHANDGWSISINGVGIFGNRVTDDGAQYDFLVQSLPELVDSLNETTRFFSPKYTFYYDADGANYGKCIHDKPYKVGDVTYDKIVTVLFDEVYLGANILDKTDTRCPDGKYYLLTETEDEGHVQLAIDLNDSAWSGFEPAENYAVNAYNSASNLKVRIRRFNHDAVVPKEISPVPSDVVPTGNSPYEVLTAILDSATGKGSHDVDEEFRKRDFYEVAVVDPSVGEGALFFNVGNITGRGDIEASELNSLLKMIQLVLPDDLRDLDLNYYDYETDNKEWVENREIVVKGAVDTYSQLPRSGVSKGDIYWVRQDGDDMAKGAYIYEGGLSWGWYGVIKKAVSSKDGLWKKGETSDPEPEIGDIWWVTEEGCAYMYSVNGIHQAYADLSIDTEDTSILNVSEADLKRALDLITQDEVYTTEGLCDLGNTSLSFQSYMANIAINDNYFYPISTVNSTNYMTIGNSATKLPQDSYKLYMSAPWDIDSASVGYKFYASPSVLYWEAVARNRRNNREFAPLFGQTNGLVPYARPVCEFNKKQRQLLLSRKVNTVFWNVPTQSWNMNDNYTKQSENTIMNDEGNSRLMIRISKAMPTLLRQFIGKRISEKLCADVVNVIEYWFKTVILPMEYSCDAYEIFCDYDEALARQNKIKVVVNVRYQRALKFIEVYNNAFDVGMDITNPDA